MKRLLSIASLVLGAIALSGCNKAPSTAETPSAAPMAPAPASGASAP